jgi:hypothetical protein
MDAGARAVNAAVRQQVPVEGVVPVRSPCVETRLERRALVRINGFERPQTSFVNYCFVLVRRLLPATCLSASPLGWKRPRHEQGNQNTV